MIDIVVDRKTENFEIKNQLNAQLPSASASDSIDIYSEDRSIADKAAGYIKACRHIDRSIRYAGTPTSEKLVEAKRLSSLSTKPSRSADLPAHLKSGIENLTGMSMDYIKVHYNSPHPANLQAHAYAQGSDIHVAPGQEKHLPHEGWHVVQQKQGRVKPTRQL